MSERGIALFGYHRAAVEVARVLGQTGRRLVIMDPDAANLGRAAAMGFETARVDHRDDTELEGQRLDEQFDTVFGLFPEDADNVFLTISIRALAPELKIVTVANDPESIPKLRAAGADKVIDTHEISGRKIWEILRRPLVTEILDRTLFGASDLVISEVTLSHPSPLEGRFLRELDLRRRYDLLVLGVVDLELGEHFVFSTRGVDHRLDAGDVLVVIGRQRDIERFSADAGPG